MNRASKSTSLLVLATFLSIGAWSVWSQTNTVFIFETVNLGAETNTQVEVQCGTTSVWISSYSGAAFEACTKSMPRLVWLMTNQSSRVSAQIHHAVDPPTTLFYSQDCECWYQRKVPEQFITPSSKGKVEGVSRLKKSRFIPYTQMKKDLENAMAGSDLPEVFRLAPLLEEWEELFAKPSETKLTWSWKGQKLFLKTKPNADRSDISEFSISSSTGTILHHLQKRVTHADPLIRCYTGKNEFSLYTIKYSPQMHGRKETRTPGLGCVKVGNNWLVQMVYGGSSACAAGLRPGMELASINGFALDGNATYDDLIALRGPPPLRLVVIGDGEEQHYELKEFNQLADSITAGTNVLRRYQIYPLGSEFNN